MTRIIGKVILMCIVLATIAIFSVSLYSSINLLTNETYAEFNQDGIQHASIGILIFLLIVCVGTFIYHLRTLRTISKIYNVHNRDMYNPRPVNRNFEAKIHKLDLVSAIVWVVGCTLVFISSTFSIYQYSNNSPSLSMRGDSTLYWLVFATLLILVGSILELLTTRSYIYGYQYLDDEIESIGK